MRSFPCSLLKFKNSFVTTAHTVCKPISSLDDSHLPFLKKPVLVILQQDSISSSKTFKLQQFTFLFLQFQLKNENPKETAPQIESKEEEIPEEDVSIEDLKEEELSEKEQEES